MAAKHRLRSLERHLARQVGRCRACGKRLCEWPTFVIACRDKPLPEEAKGCPVCRPPIKVHVYSEEYFLREPRTISYGHGLGASHHHS
jgi:hypothetical protein